MSSTIEDFRKLTELFAEGSPYSVNTVSRKATGSGDTYRRLGLKDGSGHRIHKITTERLDRAIGWFDANWPADLEWPVGIQRPSATKKRDGRAA